MQKDLRFLLDLTQKPRDLKMESLITGDRPNIMKYYIELYGPIGLERERTLKSCFRSIVENAVPIFFIFDMWLI